VDVYENQAFELDPADAAELRRRLGGFLERRADGWAVTRLVGHVVLPSGALLRIRSPKAPVASVLAWMAFVDPTLSSLRVGRRGVPVHATGDIGALTARLFVDEVLHAAAQHGLRRTYRVQRQRTATVRGAIHFPSLARSGGELSSLPCDVWERRPQTPLNALLAAAVERIRRDPVMRAACRGELAQVESLLAGVTPRVDPGLLSGRTALARTDAGFEGACALARLLLRTTGLSDGDALAGRAFLVNLEALFERTVVQALRESGLTVHAKHPARYQRTDATGTTHTATFELDALLPAVPGLGPLVVDAKYKSAISAANLQQMVTYRYLTGARHAVLVTPCGSSAAYRFDTPWPTGPVEVRTLPLDVTGGTVAEWRQAGRDLTGRLVEDAGWPAPQPAVPGLSAELRLSFP